MNRSDRRNPPASTRSDARASILGARALSRPSTGLWKRRPPRTGQPLRRAGAATALAALLAGPCLPALATQEAATATSSTAAAEEPPAGPPPGATSPPPPARTSAIEESIVVSANPIETPAEEVGSSVTVIEREKIEAFDQVTLAELLRTVPGLEITAGGGPGKVTTARVRGGNGSGLLVLIDGVRFNDTTTGAADLADLLVDGLERVEVLRGPQALYGSEALSGVLSIVTRRPDDGLALRGLLELGSDELRRGALDLGRGGDAFDAALGLAHFETDGVSQASERAGNRESDPYRNDTLTGRLGRGFGEEGRLGLSVHAFEGDTALDGFLADDPNARQERESISSVLSWSQSLGRHWHQSASLANQRLDLLGADPDDPFNNYDIRSDSLKLTTRADLALGGEARDAGTLSVGLERERREGFNLDGFDRSVDLAAGFVSHQWSVGDRWHATASVRGDHHSTFGDEVSWRVTSAIRLGSASGSGGPRLHFSYGTAFRAPSFNELYFPFSGDPALRPELSEGWDLGLAHESASGALGFDLTWFSIDFEDLIDFDLDAFVFANILEARSEGVEGSLRYRPADRVRLVATHTWNRTRDLASGADRPLARRPEHRSTLTAELDATERWRLALAAFSVQDRVESSGAAMDDYVRVDLRVDWSATSRWRPYLRVTNLLDREYEEIPGFTTPGAELAVGARLSLLPP